MSDFIRHYPGHVYMAETTEGDPGSVTALPVTEPAPDSVLSTGNTATDFIPEKYRINKEDGSFDLEASSRKVAEAHKHLEARLGSGDLPPKAPDEYIVEVEGVEGFDWDEFKADPDTQSFLKGAHAKGLNNAQVEYVIGEYLKAAPNLMGGAAQLTQQDCTAALKALWGDDQAIRTHVTASYRAAEAFASQGDAPGNFSALMSKYGNDPDFIAFTANIGKELKEDHGINNGSQVSEADFAVKTAELRQQLQDLPAHDAKRPGIQAQLEDLYNRKYNPSTSRLK